ncbi:phosphatase PAP2 family protein [Kibdelosporangium persicum]
MAGVVCAVTVVVLGLVVQDSVPVIDRWVTDSVVVPDRAVHRLLLALSTVTVLGSLVILAAVAVHAWRRRTLGLRDALLCTGLLVACGLLVASQYVFRRPGPAGQPDAFSYPSGHASVAGAFAVTAVVIAAVFARRWLRAVLVVQGTAVLLTMAARVLLAEHYVTDVIGAVLGVCAIGLLWLTAVRRWWV